MLVSYQNTELLYIRRMLYTLKFLSIIFNNMGYGLRKVYWKDKR